MKVRIIERIDATIERAWPVFSDFAGLNDLMTSMTVVIAGSGVGATRTMTAADGSKIVERLEQIDPANYSFSYAVINADAPVPFTDYRATVILLPIDKQTTSIAWSSEFVPTGVSEADIRNTMESVYRGAIRHLAAKLANLPAR